MGNIERLERELEEFNNKIRKGLRGIVEKRECMQAELTKRRQIRNIPELELNAKQDYKAIWEQAKRHEDFRANLKKMFPKDFEILMNRPRKITERQSDIMSSMDESLGHQKHIQALAIKWQKDEAAKQKRRSELSG